MQKYRFGFYLISILTLAYLSYHLYWEIHGIEIEKLKEYERVHKHKDEIHNIKEIFYAIKGYHHSKQKEKQLDNFACNVADSLLKNYNTVHITYYSYSRKSNSKMYKQHPDWDLQSYSDINDYLWDYYFDKKNVDKMKMQKWGSYHFLLYYPKPECWLKKINKE